VSPKISRGENYLGLPYLVLDYPRLFRPDAVLAIRTFFWWGHFFSSTLQLSGGYKTEFLSRLQAAQETFSKHHIDPFLHSGMPGGYGTKANTAGRRSGQGF